MDEVRAVLAGERKWAVQRSDAVGFLRSLPSDSIDLCLFSPPYEKARLYLEEGCDLQIARDTEQWVSWMVSIIGECVRVCRGLVCCVCEGQTKDYRYSAGPVLLMADLHRAGFNLRKPPAYHRVGIPGSGGPDWLRNDWEFCVCVTRPGRLPWSDNVACGSPPRYAPGGAMSHRMKNGKRVNGRMTYDVICSDGYRDGRLLVKKGKYAPPDKANPGNVILVKAGGGLLGSDLAHENEAPYPEELAAFFVRSFAPPDGIVCDPFSGSGTTLKVSLVHGRRFVGCDLRESQVVLSKRRAQEAIPWVKDETLPGDPLPLFAAV